MSDLLTLLFIASVGIAIGVAIGVLFSGGRSKPDSPEKSKEVVPEQLVKIFTIWRDTSRQGYAVELNDQRYAASSELDSGDLDFFKRTLKELDAWAGLPAAVVETGIDTAGAAVDADQLAVAAVPAAASEVTKPSLNPVNIFARALRADLRKPEPGPRSIVAQIDEILQEKLSETPEIDKSVQLKEAPDGGMVVMVGVDQYEDVDSVPDEQIRTLIKGSVAEWEKRLTV